MTHSLTFIAFVTFSLLSSCSPTIQGSNVDPIVTPLAVAAANQELENLNKEFKATLVLRDKIQTAAVALKTSDKFSSKVSHKSQSLYQQAANDMKSLNQSLKSDFEADSSKPSQNTYNASQRFENSGNAFLNYHDEVTDNARFSALFPTVVGAINGIINIWVTFDRVNRSHFLQGIDQEFQLQPWS